MELIDNYFISDNDCTASFPFPSQNNIYLTANTARSIFRFFLGGRVKNNLHMRTTIILLLY